jgi:hypothetical protein
MSDERPIRSERPIQFIDIKNPSRLWGPRPYNAQYGANGIPKLYMSLAKQVGNPDTANAIITVIEHGDGEIEYEYECLCAACGLINEAYDETVEQVVDVNVYGKPEPGTYYVKFWVQKYGGYFDPPDYDAGLEIAE